MNEAERLILDNQVTIMFAMSTNKRIYKGERKDLLDKAWKIRRILNPIKDNGKFCCDMEECVKEEKSE